MSALVPEYGGEDATRCHECGDFYWDCRSNGCPGDFVDDDEELTR